jgi:hypothetical protein
VRIGAEAEEIGGEAEVTLRITLLFLIQVKSAFKLGCLNTALACYNMQLIEHLYATNFAASPALCYILAKLYLYAHC